MWTSTLRRLTASDAIIVGMDRDAEALSKALKSLGGKVELILAEASFLPFKKGCFDLATCRRLLINLRARIRRKVLYEMIRVARAGGKVAAVETSSQANSANQFSTVSGSLGFSKRVQKAMSGTDFSLGPKVAGLFLGCGLEDVEVWAYPVLYTVLPPRYGRIDLHTLVHSGGFLDAIRTVYARSPRGEISPLRGELRRQLRRQAKRLEDETRRQIAEEQFVSVSIVPVFVTKGTKPRVGGEGGPSGS
jgi:ubiquinone/menaquinone biosynthesis C-methylase UbiE